MKENALQNVVCEIVAILFLPQCVNKLTWFDEYIHVNMIKLGDN